MVLEWYAIKIGINQLEIGWRVIFESVSTKYSKRLTPPKLIYFQKLQYIGVIIHLKFFENLS